MKRILKSALAAFLVLLTFGSAAVTSVSAVEASPGAITVIPELPDTANDNKAERSQSGNVTVPETNVPSVTSASAGKVDAELSENDKTSAVIGVVISIVAVLAVIILIITLIPKKKK